MKNVIAFILMLALFSSFTLDSSAQDYKKVLGDWSFITPQAEYGYHTGTITISEKDSDLEGSVTFPSGETVTLENITFEKNELIMELSIEYEPIKVTMNLEDNELKGTVETGGSELSITAERKK